jgi:hypothetical protein
MGDILSIWGMGDLCWGSQHAHPSTDYRTESWGSGLPLRDPLTDPVTPAGITPVGHP